jgi:valyl-tRNA synthetase
MFGDVAVVFHPEDTRYDRLRGQTVEIPLSGTRIPLLTHPSVERGFGTGMLKVTPAHDANDWEIAQGLGAGAPVEAPDILTDEGRMADVPRVPAEFRGLDRFEARSRIVRRLEEAGLLVKAEAHHHAVRHCYRCGTVVEPRLSDQWFVRMKPLADRALAEYRNGRLRLIPERWGAVYERWLSEIRDWNISRQIWFGHRIPAWYCAGGHITVAESDATSCGTCGGAVRQDDDVLDTWFSSGLWPFATLGWPEETPDLARFYPGHTLVTAPDIIFFWVARMVMLGYHFRGERPFETVLLNGVVRDAQRRRMSKSAGNGIDPVQVIRGFGADALRFTVVAGAPVGTDLLLDHRDLEGTFAPGRNFANKLWNAGRFILSHVGEGPPVEEVPNDRLELADRWILSRCHHTIAAATEAYERFRVNDAANEIYQFVWHDLADWYLEQSKPRLTGGQSGGDVARRILRHAFGIALRLLHPVMPFITETLWAHLPQPAGASPELLVRADWPSVDRALIDAAAEGRFGRVQALVTAVRTIRAEYGVDPGRSVRVTVEPSGREASDAFRTEQRTIQHLARISHLSIDGGQPAEVGAHAVLDDGSTVFVPLGDAIDLAQECSRLRRDLERLEHQLRGLADKLANPQFLSRAPAEVVERERAKEQLWREQRDALTAKVRALGC